MKRCPTCNHPIQTCNGFCRSCDRRVVYEPTQAEIREACSEIQDGWTAEQEQSRIAGSYRRVDAIIGSATGRSGRVNRRRIQDD